MKISRQISKSIFVIAAIFTIAYIFVEKRNLQTTEKKTSAQLEANINNDQNQTGRDTARSGNENQKASDTSSSKNIKTTAPRPLVIEDLDKQIPKNNYANLIPDLRERSKNGDAKSAYILGRILADCLSKNRGLGEGFAAEGADAGRCSNILIKDSSEVREWLAYAASRGIVEAQLLYPDAVGKLMSSTEMMKNPIAVEEYRNNSIQFLQDAAHGGSVEAMLMLSSAYYKGIIANQNILMAYAYRYAAINLSPAGTIDDPAVLYGANIPQNIIDNARRIGQRISSGSHN